MDLAEAFSKTSLVKKAFAIISRLAKSVGNSFGITSTEIICDRWLVYVYEASGLLIRAMHTLRRGAFL